MRFAKFWIPLTGLFLAASAAAQQPKQAPPTPSPPQLVSFPYFNSVGLNKAQKAQLKDLDEKTRPIFVRDREAMESAKRDFDEAMDSGTDSMEIRSKYEAFVTAQDTFLRTGFDQAMAVWEIMTPKQRKKFNELRRKLLQNMPADESEE